MLLGLFFISIGMGIDVSLLPEVGPRLAAQVVVLIAIKVVVLAVLCLAFGLAAADASRCALLLGQAGEFGFVLLGAAVAAGILPPEGFALAALVISISWPPRPCSPRSPIGSAGQAAGMSRLRGTMRRRPRCWGAPSAMSAAVARRREAGVASQPPVTRSRCRR